MEIKCKCGNVVNTFQEVDFINFKDMSVYEDEYICDCGEKYSLIIKRE